MLRLPLSLKIIILLSLRGAVLLLFVSCTQEPSSTKAKESTEPVVPAVKAPAELVAEEESLALSAPPEEEGVAFSAPPETEAVRPAPVKAVRSRAVPSQVSSSAPIAAVPSSLPTKPENILLDLQSKSISGGMKVQGLRATASSEGMLLEVPAGGAGQIRFEGNWDLNPWIYLSFELSNQGDQRTRFDPRAFGNGGRGLVGVGWLEAQESRFFHIILQPNWSARKSTYGDLHRDFPNMRGMPAGVSFTSSFDPKQAKAIELNFPAEAHARKVLLKTISTNRPSRPPLWKKDREAFFPFIDRYGQYLHDSWPGKILSDAQLKEDLAREQKDLAEHPGSPEWSRFGGWKGGIRRKATGRFRVEKIHGKWWIIDPEGYLFWSAGVNSAAKMQVNTPLEGREHFFAFMPEKSDPEYGQYFLKGEFDFGKLNVARKYGRWDEKAYAELGLQRMRSWGMNTLAGWSYHRINEFPESKRLPYTTFISTAYVDPITHVLPDIYSPKWLPALRSSVKHEAERIGDDPYFFGFFIDNEMHWNNADQLAAIILAKPGSSHAKQVFVKGLKRQLRQISSLNRKLGTNFKNWDELLASTKKLKVDPIGDLNLLFYEQFCERYFSEVRKAIDEFAPGSLYLGCRWHVDREHRNDVNVRIGAKYIDIISFNEYRNELDQNTFPEMAGIDRPYMITEFNFGALDSGKFYPGLGTASDQRNRGEKYRNYMESAMRDPKCVGAHWFMWANSTTSGRSHVGENANCGILSECDQPYYELIERMRKTTYTLYQYRANTP